MNEKKDEELARLVQKRNLGAFDELAKRYEEKLMRYGRRFLLNEEVAEDAVQRVFLKSYQNIQSFDTSRKFSSWIYRIAHNEFINVIKKKKRESFLFFEADTIFTYPSKENILEDIKTLEEKKEIENSLENINARYREVIILYYFEDKNYKEISEILKIPVSTVGVRLKRGRGEIKKNYEKRSR